MTKQIALRLPEEMLARLDELVGRGRFENRTEAIREAIARQLDGLREEDIAEAYRRGYGEHPQEEWVGRVGAALFAEHVAKEEAERREAG